MAPSRTDGVADNVQRVVPASTVDRHLSGAARVGLVLAAVIGTAAYGASFGVGSISNWARVWGTRVALAAGLSWPMFGLALSFASVVNLAVATTASRRGSTAFVAVHLALLLVADVSMAVYFTRKALRLGMPLSIAVILWVGVLNGTFALLLVLP